MDRVWDTSKYPPKSVMTFCQMKVIKGQNFEKDQICNFECVERYSHGM